MNPGRSSIAAALVATSLVTSACVRTSEGVPVAESSATIGVVTSSVPRSTGAAPTTASTTENAQSEPGVVPTTRAAVPAGAVTCSPENEPVVGMQAQSADPQAPRIIIAVPPGWGMSAGTGDVAARLTGPDGASATVTIAATKLEPDEAFRVYTNTIMDQAPVSAVSILPGELCSYSGQRLMGTLADESGDGIEFTDHVVHVWTNDGDYLVVVHLQTPTGATPDDAAVALITDDFEIRLP
jgi:hypothetical protein